MNLTRFRKTILIAALAVCPLLAGHTNAQSVVTTNLFQTGTGLTTFTIMPGQSFQLTLQITTNFMSSGATYFLQHQMGYVSMNPMFQLVGRDMTGNPYPDPTTTNGQLFAMPNFLNAANFGDLGSTNQGADVTGPGMFTLATLTLNGLSNLSIGTHTIRIHQGVLVDRTGGGFAAAPFNASVTVNVVPEPATVGLAVLGGGVLLFAAWRKRRAGSVS